MADTNDDSPRSMMNCPLDGVHCRETISCEECTEIEAEHRAAWLSREEKA